MKAKRRFTLIELLVVIAIIGILAAIVSFASAADTYDVAAFYWPSLHYDERWATFFPDGSQGEWESIRNCKPKWEGHWQPRIPAWGYLMDNDPAAMEKKIAAATSHGVNVMLFDWYWFENKPFLESALNDGFLKARNVDKMKFYLMWANHDAKTAWDIRRSHKLEVIWPGSVDLPTFKTVVARVINKYFSHPSYYKIDGKPVFSIYDMNNLLKGLGGVQETVEALDYFRAEVENAGFPGLHLQMIYWSRVPKIDDSGFATEKGTAANTVKTFKIDSLTNYQFVHLARPVGDYIEWADKAISNWPKWSEEFDVPYFPHVSIGWDNNARFKEIRGAITENVNPETFKKYLLKAKAYADAHPDQPKLITINAWNEWVEGSYLEPDERFGMQYLEAVRDVFVSPNAEEAALKWKTTGFKQVNSMGGGQASIPESGKFRVFVLMGQSNMQGAGRANELKAPYNEKHDRIRIWANGRWEYFVPTFRFGPGVSFAHQLADLWPDDTIGIIKVSIGGTGIRGFEKNWSFERADLTYDGKKGPLYKDLMNAVAEAKIISQPEFCGFFWKQGAADGTKKELAQQYFDTFEQLVSDLRTDLGAPDLPVFVPSYMKDEELLKVVLSGMSDEDVLKAKKSASKPPKNDVEMLNVLLPYLEDTGALKAFGKRPYIGGVIMAQNRAGRDIPNVTTVYPGDLPRIGGGNNHINAEGQIMLGKIVASAVEEFYRAKE